MTVYINMLCTYIYIYLSLSLSPSLSLSNSELVLLDNAGRWWRPIAAHKPMALWNGVHVWLEKAGIPTAGCVATVGGTVGAIPTHLRVFRDRSIWCVQFLPIWCEKNITVW